MIFHQKSSRDKTNVVKFASGFYLVQNYFEYTSIFIDMW